MKKQNTSAVKTPEPVLPPMSNVPNLDHLTLGQAKQLVRQLSGLLPPMFDMTSQPVVQGEVSPTNIVPGPWIIGKAYFIRTVTHHFTGRLIAVFPGELVLSTAAWIADDGRFADALKSGSFNEVEPFPTDAEVIIGRASIIDAVLYTNVLPISQK